ncbi:hypothetical protein GCM10018781_02110 [Kitasatospora indigofera]|uniref:Uncharacterized protein n=1 Tax=Kitasatospora indigofera TaxID=67307 RepID=A0A919FBE3_9ACTN|nr:hypothetical protein GCM10018781_02110 [Kitasatospora indigofera]
MTEQLTDHADQVETCHPDLLTTDLPAGGADDRALARAAADGVAGGRTTARPPHGTPRPDDPEERLPSHAPDPGPTPRDRTQSRTRCGWQAAGGV